MTKPIGYSYEGICKMCGKNFIKSTKSPHQIFCGSARNKIGCSYKNQLILSRKWAIINPEKSYEIGHKSYLKKISVEIKTS